MVSGNYISKKLRELRKERGLDVGAVGRGVDRSGKTISAWETGRNTPSAEMLIELCKFFDVDISYFYPSEVTYASVALQTPDDESELMEIFRSLSPKGKEQLLVYARGCAATYSKSDSDAVRSA